MCAVDKNKKRNLDNHFLTSLPKAYIKHIFRLRKKEFLWILLKGMTEFTEPEQMAGMIHK